MKKIFFLVCMLFLIAAAFLVGPVAAVTMTVNAGNGQLATVGTAVASPPSVIVKNETNNNTVVVSGVSVTFAVVSGGGSVTGSPATTDSNGVATVGSWTLGTTAGPNTLTATSGSGGGLSVNFTATATAAITPAPTISSITPSSGYNTSAVSITNLAGTGFSGTPAVVLMKTGQTNITATSVSATATQISCTFEITGKPDGYWNVVVTNPDGQSASRLNGFEIKNPGTAVTLSSITPNSGIVNSSVTITDLSGSGFLNTATIRLKRTNYNDILGTAVTIVSANKITGTFDLNNRALGTYEVCVLNDGTTATCGLAFTINSIASTTNGSINVKSSPSISKVFLSNVFEGYTPMTLYNITPGTYTVMIRSAGYTEYSERVSVTAGNISYVTASLVLSPEETTATTTAPKTTAKTVKTTAKTTAKVPTPWPSATATPQSPVNILTILGAAGLGLIVMRKW